jgi:hypothetical protein
MIEVLKQALERAERKLSAYVGVCTGDKELTDAVLPMVRQAIAELESQEPVAWMDDEEIRVVTSKQKTGMHETLQKSYPKPLYNHPPQHTKQEPVARVVLTETLELPCLQWLDLNRQFDFKGGEYLYTHPPQRTWVGLTDEEVIAASASATYMDDLDAWTFAREIEAKLKEKNT